VPLTGPEEIVEYIKTYFEEISVIVSLICMAFYQARKHKLLNRSVGTLNNNAITVAENSDRTMQAALANVQTMSAVVEAYKNEMADMLAEIRQNTDEKKKLEDALAEVHEHLKQSKLANIEFSNELAELLVLANIPNSKKDELYARHRAAVDAISTAENITASEVNTNHN
jgi:septal ring factor EnvC (AmiA/AmiB activator)